jgi:hypothetical protein
LHANWLGTLNKNEIALWTLNVKENIQLGQAACVRQACGCRLGLAMAFVVLDEILKRSVQDSSAAGYSFHVFIIVFGIKCAEFSIHLNFNRNNSFI